MKGIVVHIDELTKVCGYFNSGTPVNNFYGCNHPDCEENEIVGIKKDGSQVRFPKKIKHKISQGKCYSFSCPIASECDLEDLKEHDTDLYNEWKNAEYDPSESGAELMLITDEKIINALK